MIELQEVRKVFHAGRPNEQVAVAGVSLTLEAGKLTVFRGPSGSGKTTLLSLIGCMARPTSGRIFLKGREITSLPVRFLTDLRRRTFGFIFQQFHLLAGVSVLENVMLPAYPLGEKYRHLRARALGWLERLGLLSKAGAKAEWLSGGEAQRVAIARALINDPDILIADEPTAHLDTRLSREFMALMADFRAAGTTILIASHDPLVHEAPAVDRVVDLRDGRLLTPEAPG
ncbi:MAG: ABC transporter ATP-binding protein [Syntrophobacterales bacterium]|nr:ABC transporter ATP-binding protein [Syntrophobacterales bacterium]